MTRDLASGICAGLVCALMMLSAIGETAAGGLLASVAALPVSLITFRNGAHAGLIACLSATAAVAAIAGLSPGLNFAGAVALPAWALPFLAMPAPGKGNTIAVAPGSIAAVAALLCACSMYLVFLSSGLTYADIVQKFENSISDLFREFLKIPKDQPVTIPNVSNSAALIHTLSSIMLPMMALTSTIINLVGLWLAARIARHLQFLPFSWPDIARLRLPVWMTGVLGLSCLVALMPGDFSLAGKITLAATLGGLILQGLAVIHFTTRGNSMRPLLLGGLYVLCFVAGSLTLSVIIIIALVDTFIDLRKTNTSSGGPDNPGSHNI